LVGVDSLFDLVHNVNIELFPKNFVNVLINIFGKTFFLGVNSTNFANVLENYVKLFMSQKRGKKNHECELAPTSPQM
jgi:hypothetical protein